VIYYDGGKCSPPASLQFFLDHREKIGSLEDVVMYSRESLEGRFYPMRVRGEAAEIWLSGCSMCFASCCEVLAELGYDDGVLDWPLTKLDGFVLEPPHADNSRPVVKGKVGTRAEEIYEAIVEFMEEYGTAPVAGEIAERTSIGSAQTVYDYLKELEHANWIRRRPYWKRGIELT